MIFLPTKFVRFNFNFLGFMPLFVTGQLFFLTIRYSDEILAILQALFLISDV
jgi:hypothetical protein